MPREALSPAELPGGASPAPPVLPSHGLSLSPGSQPGLSLGEQTAFKIKDLRFS